MREDEQALKDHMRHCSWVMELAQHLKENDPKLYRALKESGKLKEHCQERHHPTA
jgi:hypothetical protein